MTTAPRSSAVPWILTDQEIDDYGYPHPVTDRWRPNAKNGDFNTCCGPGWSVAYICPCISFAQVSARIGALSYGAAVMLYFVAVNAPSIAASFYYYWWYWGPSIDGHGSSCRRSYERGGYWEECDDDKSQMQRLWIAIYLAAGATLLGFLLVLWLRRTVRRMLLIPGNCAEDVFYTLLCECCTLVQLGIQVGSKKRPGEIDRSCNPFGRPPRYTATVALRRDWERGGHQIVLVTPISAAQQPYDVQQEGYYINNPV